MIFFLLFLLEWCYCLTISFSKSIFFLIKQEEWQSEYHKTEYTYCVLYEKFYFAVYSSSRKCSKRFFLFVCLFISAFLKIPWSDFHWSYANMLVLSGVKSCPYAYCLLSEVWLSSELRKKKQYIEISVSQPWTSVSSSKVTQCNLDIYSQSGTLVIQIRSNSWCFKEPVYYKNNYTTHQHSTQKGRSRSLFSRKPPGRC